MSKRRPKAASVIKRRDPAPRIREAACPHPRRECVTLPDGDGQQTREPAHAPALFYAPAASSRTATPMTLMRAP